MILIATIVGVLILIAGGGGGSGSYFNNNSVKVLSNTEQSQESKVVEASAADTEKTEETKTNAEAVTKTAPRQETKEKQEMETVPTALPVENNKSPVGFAVLAQNALNAVIVVVVGAIALFGKMFFK